MAALASTRRSHISRPLASALWPIHREFMPAYFRIVLRHAERLPREGLFLLAPTHRSKWDSLVLSYLTGRPLRYLAAHFEFEGIQGWFMEHMGAFRIKTSWPVPGPLRHSIELVLAGKRLVIFPEGTIFYYRPGEVHPIKPGAAWLALRAQRQAPAVPVHIVPIRLNYGDRFLRFRSRIEVIVQEPIAVAPYVSRPRREGVRMLTSELQKSLGETVNTSEEERYPADGLRQKEAPHGGVRTRPSPGVAPLDPERRDRIRDLHRLRPAWNLVLSLPGPLGWSPRPSRCRRPRGRLWLARRGRGRGGDPRDGDADARGIHGTLFRRRGPDRWVGFLLRCRRVLIHGVQGCRAPRTTTTPGRLATPTISSTSRATGWSVRWCSTPGWWPGCSPSVARPDRRLSWRSPRDAPGRS